MSTATPAVAVGTLQPIAELFTGSTTALWATTYNLDLSLMSEFLLSRLGEPPLNVVVLADHHRLGGSLARIPAERVDSLATVNRRWLVRGVRAGVAFHPKTYLQVTHGRARLLVGSGNLSDRGLNAGHEVFTVFTSGTPVGDAALTTWRSWIRRLVGLVGDTVLAERFRDLEERLPPQALQLATASPLLHNLDTPIAEQLGRRLPPGRVDEVWLTAPFFDRKAAAVGALLSALTPKHVRLFVTSSSSVHGPSLLQRLKDIDADVTVAAYVPDTFVHAKLVGAVVGSEAYVLSGSANLSQAALTTTPPTGNVEMGVLAPLTVDELSALFVPPTLKTEHRDVADLERLDFRSEPEPPAPPVRLLTAVALGDGRIQLTTDPAPEQAWLVDDLTGTCPLATIVEDRATTAAAVTGRLVQLVDSTGAVLSNRVVVDDPAGLAATLNASTGGNVSNRPSELGASDLESPLAQALVWLHRNLVMDVSERATPGPAGGVTTEESASADDDLWDRLEREQLARDPRAATYARLWGGGAGDASDPIIELLDAMRGRVASEGGLSRRGSVLAHLLDERSARESGTGEDVTDDRPVHRWSLSARVRVRARNVLRRWAAAQTDPRLVWVDPLAPAGNFAMVAELLAILRLHRAEEPASVEFDEADLDDLWRRWLESFVGTGEGDGWLDRLDGAERTAATARLPIGTGEVIAALCWLLVRPGSDRRERVVAYQRLLESALSHGLIEPTDNTASYLSAVVGETVTRPSVDDTLVAAIEFVDDPLWCERVRSELRLDRLSIAAPPGGGAAQVRLDVAGVVDPLLDPRVPRLVAAVRHYRKCDGVAVYSLDQGWRLVFNTGDTVAYRSAAGEHVESATPTIDGILEGIAGEGGVLQNLFAQRARAAG
jgi:hypothetical protein